MIISIPKKAVVLTPYQFRKLKWQSFARDGFRCQLPGHVCGGELQPHHIILRSRLHLDILENLLTCCFDGHRLLHLAQLEITVDDLIDQYGLRHYLR